MALKESNKNRKKTAPKVVVPLGEQHWFEKNLADSSTKKIIGGVLVLLVILLVI